jgi:hypothetical protein
MSVAGVHRRAMRRTYGVGAGYYGAGYGGWGWGRPLYSSCSGPFCGTDRARGGRWVAPGGGGRGWPGW